MHHFSAAGLIFLIFTFGTVTCLATAKALQDWAMSNLDVNRLPFGVTSRNGLWGHPGTLIDDRREGSELRQTRRDITISTLAFETFNRFSWMRSTLVLMGNKK